MTCPTRSTASSSSSGLGRSVSRVDAAARSARAVRPCSCCGRTRRQPPISSTPTPRVACARSRRSPWASADPLSVAALQGPHTAVAGGTRGVGGDDSSGGRRLARAVSGEERFLQLRIADVGVGRSGGEGLRVLVEDASGHVWEDAGNEL